MFVWCVVFWVGPRTIYFIFIVPLNGLNKIKNARSKSKLEVNFKQSVIVLNETWMVIRFISLR